MNRSEWGGPPTHAGNGPRPAFLTSVVCSHASVTTTAACWCLNAAIPIDPGGQRHRSPAQICVPIFLFVGVSGHKERKPLCVLSPVGSLGLRKNEVIVAKERKSPLDGAGPQLSAGLHKRSGSRTPWWKRGARRCGLRRIRSPNALSDTSCLCNVLPVSAGPRRASKRGRGPLSCSG